MSKQEIKKATWSELTEDQKKDAAKQLKFTGYKHETEYSRLTFQINPEGKIHGWIDKNFFL